jgi:hypothetical protein
MNYFNIFHRQNEHLKGLIGRFWHITRNRCKLLSIICNLWTTVPYKITQKCSFCSQKICRNLSKIKKIFCRLKILFLLGYWNKTFMTIYWLPLKPIFNIYKLTYLTLTSSLIFFSYFAKRVGHKIVTFSNFIVKTKSVFLEMLNLSLGHF